MLGPNWSNLHFMSVPDSSVAVSLHENTIWLQCHYRAFDCSAGTDKERFCFLHLHLHYAFSRHFYPKRLTVHSGYHFLSVCVFPDIVVWCHFHTFPWHNNCHIIKSDYALICKFTYSKLFESVLCMADLGMFISHLILLMTTCFYNVRHTHGKSHSCGKL